MRYWDRDAFSTVVGEGGVDAHVNHRNRVHPVRSHLVHVEKVSGVEDAVHQERLVRHLDDVLVTHPDGLQLPDEPEQVIHHRVGEMTSVPVAKVSVGDHPLLGQHVQGGVGLLGCTQRPDGIVLRGMNGGYPVPLDGGWDVVVLGEL